MIKWTTLPAFALALVVALPVAAADTPPNLDALLEKVKAGRVQDAKENAARLEKFKADKAAQARLLEQARGERSQGEARSHELETAFEENDQQLVELEAQLKERLGSLKELFGVLQQAAGDARGQFENSLTHVQFPERIEFLNELAQKMGQTNRLASMEEIERLWFELQREMTETGKVVRFPAKVITLDGAEVEKDVVRVGAFNVVADGKYLSFVPETGNLIELGRQPAARYVDRIPELTSATSGYHPFALDPSRGQILSLLIQAPSLRERIDQGGVVGYVTIGLGVLGLLIALERLLVLTVTGMRVRLQARNPDKPGNNPLGRVLKVYHDNPKADVETLELKLSEAILRETPRINRLLMFLKIIAVVAPLLGLLGTVTGMIITFQAITLFGTGDPKLMAGGISTALITTVIGLCVAIPIVLLHTLVSTRARRLTQILEEQAAGLVAAQSEQRHAA
ncbi:MAG: MotA/TolQ/ExbB proton channel family protein [Gammaproteobacteria bacterium]|nr:MotA/TolQ/ExbB proton channel family protein [Gammaproteobacteria bacterium]MCP5198619.1 MotA/TolQ/ExbB proton channel family protein [Gammaproteobacteria bacterium]